MPVGSRGTGFVKLYPFLCTRLPGSPINKKIYNLKNLCYTVVYSRKDGSGECAFKRERVTGTRRNIIKPIRISIRPAYRDEWDDAMSLAWRTFMQFEAQDFTPAGVESFQEFITDTILYRMFMLGSYQLFGAYDNGRMVGMISLRGETHISLLFVDGKYHRMGIGRGLIEYVSRYVLTEEGHDGITVNAAPYATGFYHRMGFVDTSAEQASDGIRYTPMKRNIQLYTHDK